MSAGNEARVLETKIVILGQSGVGKTSMVNQYVRGQFSGNTTATIGAAFMKKEIVINNCKIILQIWDTAGQERFRSMAPMYYRGAHAAILVFDVSSPESLEQASSWVGELQNYENSLIVLAANKADLRLTLGENCVSAERGAAFAKSLNAAIFETSAKTGKGVEDLFEHIAGTLLKADIKRKQQQQQQTTNAQHERNRSHSFHVKDQPQATSCC